MNKKTINNMKSELKYLNNAIDELFKNIDHLSSRITVLYKAAGFDPWETYPTKLKDK